MRDFFNRIRPALVRRLVCNRSTFRGSSPEDGRFTLITVDYHSTDVAIRLIRSFRKFFDQAGEVVVVQNGDTSGNARLRAAGARVVGWGHNFGHGVGMDYGLFHCRTQYALICDPDTAIVSSAFRDEAVRRIREHGVVSVDNGCHFHHPICLGFEANLWKRSRISMQEQWSHEPTHDTGGALTYQVLGGLRRGGLIPRTRTAGKQLPSSREGMMHGYGEVFGDVFTNTYCVSRKKREPDRQDFEGWSRQELDTFHDAWNQWIEDLLVDRATVDDFPGERVGVALSVA